MARDVFSSREKSSEKKQQKGQRGCQQSSLEMKIEKEGLMINQSSN